MSSKPTFVMNLVLAKETKEDRLTKPGVYNTPGMDIRKQD